MKRSLPKPQIPPTDDISKMRNLEDKSIVFKTDADTSLRDFYWKYKRGIEPYDSTQYEITIPGSTPTGLTSEEKEQYKNTNQYELTFYQ